MDIYINYSDLLILAGLFIAVVMSIGIGIKTKRHTANIWLVGFLISSALVLIVKFLYSTGYIIFFPHWFKVNYPAGILRPIFIFLYVKYLLSGIKRIKARHLLHFLPFFILIIYLSPFFVQNADYKTAVLNRELVNTLGLLPSWYIYFQIGYSILYIIAVYFDLRKYIKANPGPNRLQKNLIRWIIFLLWGGSFYLLSAMTLQIFGLIRNFNYYLYEIFSVGLILLCIKLITLPELVRSLPANKYKNSPLSKIEIDQYFSLIYKLMEERAFFKRDNLKLRDIASELNLPDYLISQVINQKTGQSFRYFINRFRIKAAKKMLVDSRDQYSIEGIAKDVGFNSRASFYNAFKKETNQTPTEYIMSIDQVV